MQNVQNTFETPQSQTVEKVVEIPQIRTFQGTRASESLETAPGRHVAFSEMVQVKPKRARMKGARNGLFFDILND